MTLLEIMVVVTIVAFMASGLSLSLGALSRTNLKAGATRVAAAVRYAYNRAITRGNTVRLVFTLPGSSLSIEEAHGRVTLARANDARRQESLDEDGDAPVSVDPWAAAKSRIENAMAPTLGASPFGPITNLEGEAIKRYQQISLGRRVNLLRLIVPHEPGPKERGKGAIHFFPGGYSEHAILHLSDGRDGFMSVEVHPLTGRAKIHRGLYEPRELLDDPEHLISEVDE